MKFYLIILTAFLVSICNFVLGQSEDLEMDSYKTIDEVNELNERAFLLFDSIPELGYNYARRALDLAEEIKFEYGIAAAHLNIGEYYRLKVIRTKELEHYLEAMPIFEKIRDSTNLAQVLRRIGWVYGTQELIEKMETYLTKSISIYKNLNDPFGLTQCYMTLGNSYLQVKKYDQSSKAYLTGMSTLVGVEGAENLTAGLLNNLGIVHTEQENYLTSLDYLRQSQAIYKRINNIERLPASNFNISNAFKGLHQFDSAYSHALYAFNLAKELKIDGALIDVLPLLVELNEIRNNKPEALRFQKMYSALADSIHAIETRKIIDNYMAGMEAEENAREVEELHREQEITKLYNRLTVTGFIFVIILLTLIFLIWKSRQNRLLEIIKTQQRLAQTELENISLKKQLLDEELEFKNKEITAHAVNAVQKNSLLKELRDQIQQLMSNGSEDNKTGLQKLINQIDYSSTLDRDWQDFKTSFENVHHNFFARLKERFETLTSKELELCALIKLNRNLKESSIILGISPESVKMSRHRLKKKLGLNNDEKLNDFILKF